MHMQHIYIYIYIFTYYIIYATILCFTLVLQASNILRRPCQKRGPVSQRCTTRPCEDKPNIILCENRTPGPLGNQQMHTGDSEDADRHADRWFVQTNGRMM